MEIQEFIESSRRLSRDLREAGCRMGPHQARFMVDSYYIMQKQRIRSGNQIKALSGSKEPFDVISFTNTQFKTLEEQVQRTLDGYSAGHPVGEWARRQKGLGPVITAGLLAHIDIKEAPTVGHIWRFAGLDPTLRWNKNEKRPWNASLKTLCWKLGESFTKVSGYEDAFYGHVYVERKAREVAKNEAGDFADQAAVKLRDFRIGKSTEAYKWYAGCLSAEAARTILAAEASLRPGLFKKLAGEPGSGVPMLPPSRIQLRAQRVAVKLFLAHFHHKLHEHEFGCPPPKPYVIENMGHAHYMAPPD